jgi:peptidoglycan/xylan/chitin deacetylase (PgdA/CDA1 family)
MAVARTPVVSSVSIDERLVALTFDDGPDPEDTEALLDLLDEASAVATFFVQGSELGTRTRRLVKRMASAGHEVGNHTHSHLDLSTQDVRTIRQEVARTHRDLGGITGRPPNLIRPPYGRGTEAVSLAAHGLGYRAVVLWSAQADDGTAPQPTSEVIVERVLNGHDTYLGVNPGTIVLLHDGGADREAGESRRETVEAVRALVPALRAEGYRLVTVGELLSAADGMGRDGAR